MLKRLVLGVLLCIGLGFAIETNLGAARRVDPALARRVEDPAGRRLLLMVLDSFRYEDAAGMPALQRLAAAGFSGPVEPCLERITYVCVKEALTGRGAFSLFGVLQNWGAAADPGENLLRDARRAGRRTAMVSAGDLAPFAPDLDREERFPKDYAETETRAALDFARDHDVVVYHYIWHDTDSHHYRAGSPGYVRSVAFMDDLVGRVAAGLPEGMDLVVTGDHGHDARGKHVQGQDIPTFLVAVSPNLRPGREEERIPIAAVRFLAAGVAGLWSDQFEWRPDWERWLADPVGAEARGLVRAGHVEIEPGFPVGAVLVCLVAGAVAWWTAGPWAAIAVLALGTALGLTFEQWLAWMHFPSGRPRIHTVFWIVPVAGALAGLGWRRRLDGLWEGAAVAGVVGLVALYPVVHHYGVLKNAHWLGLSATSAAALGLLLRRPGLARSAVAAGVAVAAALAWVWLGDFKVFNLEIVSYRGAAWVEGRETLAALVSALLAAIVHVGIETGGWKRRLPWAALAAAGALGMPALPPLAYALPMAVVTVGIALPSRARGRLLSIGIAFLSPYVYDRAHQFGLYGVLVLLAAGLWLVAQQVTDESPPRPLRWTASLLLVVGAYVVMAWTFGLTVSGVDFDFMVQWLPGRWHERLWWLIFIGTTVKVLMPIALLPELSRGMLGARGGLLAEAAGALAIVRCSVIMAFATAWMIASGKDAAGIRLAMVLQDSFFYALTGLVIVGGGRLGAPRAAAR